MYCYANKLTFSVFVSDQKFENSMDLLLMIDENKSHYGYIKDFNRLCFTKERINTKNTFARVGYSILVVEKYWESIKKFVCALMTQNL